MGHYSTCRTPKKLNQYRKIVRNFIKSFKEEEKLYYKIGNIANNEINNRTDIRIPLELGNNEK